MIGEVGNIARSDPWLCAEMLRGGILGEMLSALHRLRIPGQADRPTGDTPGATVSSYTVAAVDLLPCFASVAEV